MATIKKLISVLDEYAAGRASVEDIENCTMGLISSDDFGLIPEPIQDEVYALDMHDVNEFNREDILEIRNTLKELCKNK